MNYYSFLSIWATLNLAEALVGEVIWEYMNVISYTSLGLVGLILSMPLIFQVAQKLYPESKEKIENFQRTYSTAIKIINMTTAGIVLGCSASSLFIYGGISLIKPILLSSASLISSAYLLHRNAQISAGSNYLNNAKRS